jgi:DNA-binding NarL/FixJ family response regulator
LGQKTRVIILQSDKLLNAGVQSLLSTRPDVEVIGVAHSNESYASILDRTQPDIVIMDEHMICANVSAYLAILRDYPDLRTIVLRLGDNQMHVYDKRIVEVEHLGDFLELL